jgi:hypothetical protein
MKEFAWAVVACLAVSVFLLVLFFPVVDRAGPGWVGHVHLEWDILKFDRIWKRDGRPVHAGALLVEIGAGVLLGILIFAGGRSLRARGPEGKGGVV